MPKIITLAHQKGGVGKSTISLNLAFAFSGDLRVALLDTDIQGTISQLKPLIQGIDILPSNTPIVDLPHLKEYDVIIVDTPPYLSKDLTPLMNVSDLIIVPTKASIPDLLAIRATIKLIKEGLAKNTKLRTAALITMAVPNAGLNDEIMTDISQLGVDVLKTLIHQRESYKRSMVTNGVANLNDKKAIREITSLGEEIIEML